MIKSYLIFIADAADIVRGDKFCHIEKFCHMEKFCHVEKFWMLTNSHVSAKTRQLVGKVGVCRKRVGGRVWEPPTNQPESPPAVPTFKSTHKLP